MFLLRPLSPLWRGALIPLRRSVPSTALYFLNSPLSPLQFSALLQSSVLSSALCPLYAPMFPLRPFVPSMALCSFHCPLSSLWPFVFSTALSPLYGPLYLYSLPATLWPSVSSAAICPILKPSVPSLALCSLFGLLFPWRPSILSMALCFIYNSPLSPIRISVPSTALYPLCGHLSFLWSSAPSTVFYPVYGPLFSQQSSVFSTALCLLYCPYPFYGPLFHRRHSVFSSALCLLYNSLSPPWPSGSSTALCSLYGILFPLRPSILSLALYPLLGPLPPLRRPLYSPVSPLRPSAKSKALYPHLCGPLPLNNHLYSLLPSVSSTSHLPLWPFTPSKALFPLYGPLSPLQPCVPSSSLCLLSSRLKIGETSKTTPLVSRNVLRNVFHQNPKDYCDLFRIGDNRDHCDYCSCETLSDHSEIKFITLVKKVVIIAIVTSNKRQ